MCLLQEIALKKRDLDISLTLNGDWKCVLDVIVTKTWDLERVLDILVICSPKIATETWFWLRLWLRMCLRCNWDLEFWRRNWSKQNVTWNVSFTGFSLKKTWLRHIIDLEWWLKMCPRRNCDQELRLRKSLRHHSNCDLELCLRMCLIHIVA